MNDSQKKKNEPNVDTNIPERPLDPSRNASDIMGDPSGMTGWTVGNGPETSAEPTEEQISEENLPGGFIEEDKPHNTPTGIPKEAVNDSIYNRNAWKSMSQTKAAQSDDTAEEGESFRSVRDMIQGTDEDTPDPYDPDALRKASAGDDSPGSDEINTETAPYSNPENIGEQEVSGSETDPNSDDDTLANAQAVGTQVNEDSENPQELDVARDIDAAEEYHRTH